MAGLGKRFVLAVDAALELIRREPALYPEVRPRIRRALVRGFPYGVFYTDSPEEIVVLAIVHARRDPGQWPSRPTG